VDDDELSIIIVVNAIYNFEVDNIFYLGFFRNLVAQIFVLNSKF
jgi:hypothetical protein